MPSGGGQTRVDPKDRVEMGGGFTLVPPGEYDWTIRARQPSIYFYHLFVLAISVLFCSLVTRDRLSNELSRAHRYIVPHCNIIMMTQFVREYKHQTLYRDWSVLSEARHCLNTDADCAWMINIYQSRRVPERAGTSAVFWLGGSMPPCRLRRRKFRKFDYDMVHSEVYLNKCGQHSAVL